MRPCFVIGFQRSGTTLLRLMLDNHPEIAIPLDVTGLWARYHARLGRYDHLRAETELRRLVEDLTAEERIRLWGLDLTADEVLRSLSAPGFPGVIDAFYTTYARRKGKRYWADKDPGNMTRLHLVQEWFPDARVIHIIRDGRDACLSLLAQEFGYDDLLPCAAGWREQVWWVRCIGTVLGPERYHEVRYEDLVAEPEARLREISAFLGVEYSPAMLAYPDNVEKSIPASKRHIWPLIDRPPQKDNVGRWKSRMSPAERICFEKRAGDVLRELRYEVLPDSPSGAYVEELRSLLRRLVRGVAARGRALATR